MLVEFALALNSNIVILGVVMTEAAKLSSFGRALLMPDVLLYSVSILHMVL